MASLNPLDRENLGRTGVEADQGFALEKPTEPLEQQVGADDELQRGLERVAALEAWLSAGRGQENGLNALGLGDSQSDQIPDHQTTTQGIGVPQGRDRTLVVVDSRLSNWQDVAAGLPSDADLLLLNHQRSGCSKLKKQHRVRSAMALLTELLHCSAAKRKTEVFNWATTIGRSRKSLT